MWDFLWSICSLSLDKETEIENFFFLHKCLMSVSVDPTNPSVIMLK